MRRLLMDLWANLHHGVAFSLFMRRSIADFRIGIDQLLALLLFSLALDVALDHILNRPDPVFNFHALAPFALNFLLFSLSAYLIAGLLRRKESMLTIVLLAYSCFFLIDLIESALLNYAGEIFAFSKVIYSILFYLVAIWSVLLLVRIVLHACEARRRAALMIVPVFLLVWVVPLTVGEWNDEFWYPTYPATPDVRADYRRMDAEALLYAQPKMVEKALDELQPQRRGVSDLYFVSFGSYAFQDVFMKEVRYAHHTMDTQFDTRGHSLELVNNLQTRDELPLATASNLRLVLNSIGQSMDRDEDVLMLYLTSHGSMKSELAVDFWPLPLNDISPVTLRQMLDEAGIKWRVIVVSACYSGGFIDVLRDEQTVIATAAAKDRQSFGCSNENDFTYYGEALFRNALRRGQPLVEALRQARESIHAREKREKLAHSLPQLHVGSEIEAKLNAMSEPRLIECGGSYKLAKTVGC